MKCLIYLCLAISVLIPSSFLGMMHHFKIELELNQLKEQESASTSEIEHLIRKKHYYFFTGLATSCALVTRIKSIKAFIPIFVTFPLVQATQKQIHEEKEKRDQIRNSISHLENSLKAR